MHADRSAEVEVAEFAGQLFFRLWRAPHSEPPQRCNRPRIKSSSSETALMTTIVVR
jgi:hypothetical protein